MQAHVGRRLDLGRVGDQAPAPAALEEPVGQVELAALGGTRADGDVVAEPGVDLAQRLAELVDDLPGRAALLVDGPDQLPAVGLVGGEDVDGEAAQEADHRGGEPLAGPLLELVHLIEQPRTGDHLPEDLGETDDGEHQRDGDGEGVDHVQLLLRGLDLLALVLGAEVGAAGEARRAVRRRVALDVAGERLEQPLRHLDVVAEHAERVEHVPVGGVGVVQPEDR
nr:hypothetical protein GCM10020092_048020 [Actinoplanes digitatis]